MNKFIFSLLVGTFSIQAFAKDNLMKDFDSLGGNDVLLERAQAINPEVKTQIVQNRVVNLKKRFEASPEFSMVLGGDSYTNTWMAGVTPQFHINPHWAVGFKYAYAFNSLSNEGANMINHPTPIHGGNGSVVGYEPNVPAVDYIKQQGLLTLNWSPIYGKMNILDKGVAHFDVYGIVGGGKIELESGWKTTYTAGGGFGLWISQHLSSHLELRWQGYQAQRFADRNDDMNLTVGSLQFGYLL